MTTILQNIYSNLDDIFNNLNLKEYIDEDFDPDEDLKIIPSAKVLKQKKVKLTKISKDEVDDILRNYNDSNIEDFLSFISDLLPKVDDFTAISIFTSLLIKSLDKSLVIQILDKLKWFSLSFEVSRDYLLKIINTNKKVAENSAINILNSLIDNYDPKLKLTKFSEYMNSILILLNSKTRQTFNTSLLFLSSSPSYAIPINKLTTNVKYLEYLNDIRLNFLKIEPFLKVDNDDVNEDNILVLINKVFSKYKFNECAILVQQAFIIKIIEKSNKLPIKPEIINNVIKSDSLLFSQYNKEKIAPINVKTASKKISIKERKEKRKEESYNHDEYDDVYDPDL